MDDIKLGTLVAIELRVSVYGVTCGCVCVGTFHTMNGIDNE